MMLFEQNVLLSLLFVTILLIVILFSFIWRDSVNPLLIIYSFCVFVSL